jgi:uncharacterized protein (UPF0335 family)
MKTIEIATFEDILEALRGNPIWVEQMRAIILSEELLTLPERFERFLRNEFRPLKEKTDKIEKDVEVLKADVKVLKEDVEVLKQDVAVLKEDVAVLKQDVAILKQDVRGLKVDVNTLKGESFENKVRDRAPAFFGKLLRRTRVITTQDFVDALDDAVDAGLISDNDRDYALNADVVVRGKMKDSGKEVILVGEASVTVDLEDVERASKRAEITAKAFRQEAIGVVVGKEITDRAQKAADEFAVLVL